MALALFSQAQAQCTHCVPEGSGLTTCLQPSSAHSALHTRDPLPLCAWGAGTELTLGFAGAMGIFTDARALQHLASLLLLLLQSIIVKCCLNYWPCTFTLMGDAFISL